MRREMRIQKFYLFSRKVQATLHMTHNHIVTPYFPSEGQRIESNFLNLNLSISRIQCQQEKCFISLNYNSVLIAIPLFAMFSIVNVVIQFVVRDKYCYSSATLQHLTFFLLLAYDVLFLKTCVFVHLKKILESIVGLLLQLVKHVMYIKILLYCCFFILNGCDCFQLKRCMNLTVPVILLLIALETKLIDFERKRKAPFNKRCPSYCRKCINKQSHT